MKQRETLLWERYSDMDVQHQEWVKEITVQEQADLAYKLDPRKIRNKNRLKFIKNYVNGFFFRMKTENFVADKKKRAGGVTVGTPSQGQ